MRPNLISQNELKLPKFNNFIKNLRGLLRSVVPIEDSCIEEMMARTLISPGFIKEKLKRHIMGSGTEKRIPWINLQPKQQEWEIREALKKKILRRVNSWGINWIYNFLRILKFEKRKFGHSKFSIISLLIILVLASKSPRINLNF